MKVAYKSCVVVLLVMFTLFSCDLVLKDSDEVAMVAEVLVAAVVPVTGHIFNFDLTAAAGKGISDDGYTQAGGGSIQLIYVADAAWESAYDEPVGGYTFTVIFTDFLVPMTGADYLLNGTFTFHYYREVIDTDYLFTFTIWGSDISVSGNGINDRFDVDMQAVIDIDIIYEGITATVDVSGSLEGVMRGISVDVADWVFSFSYDHPYTAEI